MSYLFARLFIIGSMRKNENSLSSVENPITINGALS